MAIEIICIDTLDNELGAEARNVKFDGTSVLIASRNVQGAIEELKHTIDIINLWYQTNKDNIVSSEELDREVSDQINETLGLVDGRIPVSMLPESYQPVVVNDDINQGSLAAARAAAAQAPDNFFQWIYTFNVTVNGSEVTARKVIWHIPGEQNNGNGYFMDAFGDIIS